MRFRSAIPMALLSGLLVALAGCVTPIPDAVNTASLSPLQVRAMQTRTYDQQDAKTALKAVLNVLQDEGFLVDYGSTDLGLLHASKTLSLTADGLFYQPARPFNSLNSSPEYGVATTIEATANVSEFGNRARIRIGFQRKRLGWSGTVISATPISDTQAYQEFFAKLERGLFIQNQGL